MTRPLLRLALTCAAGASVLGAAPSALAGGAAGHRIIGRIALQALPAEIPAFLRTAAAVDLVGELAREPDRSKGSGQPHDADSDPGHFLDLGDDAHVWNAQGPAIDALPHDREDYDTALRAAGVDQEKTGWLPYTIVDGYQQLVHDFAIWRADEALTRTDKNPQHHAWYVADLKLREAIVIRDLGVWAHYVGDGSQPMHVSVHYNGWGDYPNPNNYTQEHIHGPFEGAFVHATQTDATVRAVLPAPATCGPTIQACTAAYLTTTMRTIPTVYTLWGQGAFAGPQGTPAGRAFAAARLAAAAAELRDLTVRAWKDSLGVSLGYKPSYTVRSIVEGFVPPFGSAYGDD